MAGRAALGVEGAVGRLVTGVEIATFVTISVVLAAAVVLRVRRHLQVGWSVDVEAPR